MDSEILNRNASETAKFPAFDWPASNRTTFLPKEFWTVALFGGFGVMVLLGLVYATLGSGIDLTIGSMPIDTTMQAVQAASAGS